MRGTAARRTPSRTLWVTMTFCSRSRRGESQPNRTSALAARWTTACAPPNSSGRRSGSSKRSHTTEENRSEVRASSRWRSNPVLRLSIDSTSCPADSRAATRLEPTNPAPPVTTTFWESGVTGGSLRLRRLLQRFPPPAIVAIPVDGGLECLVQRAGSAPPERRDLRDVDRIPAIVPEAVGDVLHGFLADAEQREQLVDQ